MSVLSSKGKITKFIRSVAVIFRRLDTQNGVSIIETIIALTIILALTSLISTVIHSIDTKSDVQPFEEATLFFSMIGKNFREGTSFQVENNVLYITNNKGEIETFSKYATLVRKQINGKGHEVWLQEISVFQPVKISDQLLKINITDREGSDYEHVFRRIKIGE